VTESAWLLIVLVLLAVGALALTQQRRRKPRLSSPPSADRDSDLRTLGISDVRPRAASAFTPVTARAPLPPGESPRAEGPAPEEDAAWDDDADAILSPPRPAAASTARPSAPPVGEPDEETPAGGPTAGSEPPLPEPAMPEASPDRSGDSPLLAEGVSQARPITRPRVWTAPPPLPHVADESPLWAQGSAIAIKSLLESLYAALGAQSVALLHHEADRGTLGVDVLICRSEDRRTAAFPAAANALLHVPDDGSISVLDPDVFRALRFHAEPETTVGRAAAVRVPAALPTLLVVDVPPGRTAFARIHLDLLGDYADLLGGLLRTGGDAAAEEPAAPQETPAFEGDLFVPPPPSGDGAGDEAAAAVAEAPPRKRSEIIAEEMAAARAEAYPLAFALVVADNSEAVATAGPEAVAEAEAALFARLEAVPGTGRVERFGELLAGVFCYTDAVGAEGWATRVQSAGAPVFIGAAVLAERHHGPEDLRNDAATALQEAYERQEACVILE